ncbi:MAG: hypothetical protein BIFFINMI_02068 [Phycisphaerae bacterium]|nr:hypothetical protein [Phycisphaerae bacterium]
MPTAGGGAAPAWLLLGWTARGAADSTLYAWLVAPRGRRLAVAQVSLSGGAGHTRMIWMPASGRLGLFLPQDPALRAGCKANVAGREIPPADLAASAVAPPQRSGTWYARDRLVGEDPGPGSVWWVDLSALLADMPAELLTRPQPATQPTTAPDR